jgi:hypothetical protein
MAEEFPELKERATQEDQFIDDSHGLDGMTAAKELGYEYRSFRDTVKDLVSQAIAMDQSTK